VRKANAASLSNTNATAGGKPGCTASARTGDGSIYAAGTNAGSICGAASRTAAIWRAGNITGAFAVFTINPSAGVRSNAYSPGNTGAFARAGAGICANNYATAGRNTCAYSPGITGAYVSSQDDK